MASVEMVTVRMSRGDIRTPWGFEIIPPCTVTKIIGSSLADRAGLHNGDHIDELQGIQGLSYESALNLLQSASHEIELVVLRDPTIASSTARLWKPHVTVDKMPINNFQGYPNISPQQQNAPQTFSSTYKTDYSASISPSVKVSLEHQPVVSLKPIDYGLSPL
uniref:PDZ domain-containing protein n=1 Tax=Panagrolaimus superbus TaxID=310955 RepID=A0A914YZP6_9BILA